MFIMTHVVFLGVLSKDHKKTDTSIQCWLSHNRDFIIENYGEDFSTVK